MRIKYLKKLTRWYNKNLGKLVFLLITIVFITLTLVYTPFLNVVITPEVRYGICVVVWYILFSPKTKTIILVSLISLGVGIVYTIFGLSSFIDSIGVFIFILIIFIFINYIKEEIV